MEYQTFIELKRSICGIFSPIIMKKTHIIYHHSGVSREVQPNQFWTINNYHKQKWHFKSQLSLYGGYTYLIEPNGKIKQYRLETETAAHCIGMNDKSVGICLSGHFSKELPTEAQKTALQGLLLELVKKYNIPLTRIVGHRYFAKAECPGRNLSNDWAQQLVATEYQKSDNEKEIELLKKQISIIEKIIQVYIRLLALLQLGKADN